MQKCVVVGTCVLWVKHGSVSIYGAVLTASKTVYRIYAPTTHELPGIQSATTNAEIELESLHDGLNALPYLGVRDMWAATGDKRSASSFYVLGHSLEQDPKAPRRLKELEIYPWKSWLAAISESEPTSPPRILMCGRRSSGLSALVRCTLNRLLSKQLAISSKSSERGAAILDLDTYLPEFALPGIISLVRVRGPMFGPPFANLLSTSQSTSGQILKSHFLGDIGKTDLEDWHLARVHDLLDLQRSCRKKYQQVPEIVIVPKWLNDIDRNTASMLWNKVAPTDVVFLDQSPVTTHLEVWRSLAANGTCRIHQLPVQHRDGIAIAREHDLQMQSYFHRDDSSINRPLWDESPVLAATRQIVTLSYRSEDAQVCGILLLGGHVALEDTYEALDGSLVALVAVRATDSLVDDDGELKVDSFVHGSDLHPGEIQLTEEDLPRWRGQPGQESSFPLAAHKSFCLGMAFVQEIDIPNRRINFITGPELHVDDIQEQGYRIALVMSRATADGRFRPAWAQREMGMPVKGSGGQLD